MKFTLSWLKDHLDVDASVEEIGARLTMLGHEVESIANPAEALAGFTVAQVVEARQHPNADRLRVCTVDAGGGKTLQVVCGAPNARAGIKVVLAQPGTRIPASGDVLKKGAIRGVESQGMMCSWRELGLGEDHEGIAELDEGLAVGTPLTRVMAFDPVFDVSITPNRADCLGVRGIARDLAASGMGRLKPFHVEPVPARFPSPVTVALNFPDDAKDACTLFAGRYIRGVRNGPSPQWLQDRLREIGLRPISALVDITNYVTYEHARPLHVFDADKLEGNVQARLARPGETLLALNGKEYVLDEAMTVIADDVKAEALAGVIGGEETGCTEATVNVFVESALFDPVRTAATGRKLDIVSDARFRFERGVDPAFAIPAMELATRMIIELCGGEPSEPVIAGAEPHWHRSIDLRPGRVAELGGVELPLAEIERILTALGCRVTPAPDGLLVVEPPSWRWDLTIEQDLVEEVIRIHGYDNVPVATLPRDAMPRPMLTLAQRRAGFVRRGLASRGMYETVTWSFTRSEHARLFAGGQAELFLANPISSDLDVMRPSVLPNLIAAAGRNADRGFKDLALFEIGPQFDGGTEPGQQRQVCAGIRTGRTGPRHWAQPPRAVDVYDAKADALAAIAAAGGPADSLQVATDAPSWYHPGRSGTLKLGNKPVAWFGEVHPRVLKAMDVAGPLVAFEVLLDAIPQPKAKPTKARPLLKASPFQPVERDFAFVLDRTVPAASLVKAARDADKQLIADVQVFDLFEGPSLGEGRKSLAISVTLQPTEKTLTDAEIEAVGQKIVAAVTKATGGSLRG